MEFASNITIPGYGLHPLRPFLNLPNPRYLDNRPISFPQTQQYFSNNTDYRSNPREIAHRNLENAYWDYHSTRVQEGFNFIESGRTPDFAHQLESVKMVEREFDVRWEPAIPSSYEMINTSIPKVENTVEIGLQSHGTIYENNQFNDIFLEEKRREEESSRIRKESAFRNNLLEIRNEINRYSAPETTEIKPLVIKKEEHNALRASIQNIYNSPSVDNSLKFSNPTEVRSLKAVNNRSIENSSFWRDAYNLRQEKIMEVAQIVHETSTESVFKGMGYSHFSHVEDRGFHITTNIPEVGIGEGLPGPLKQQITIDTSGDALKFNDLFKHLDY